MQGKLQSLLLTGHTDSDVVFGSSSASCRPSPSLGWQRVAVCGLAMASFRWPLPKLANNNVSVINNNIHKQKSKSPKTFKDDLGKHLSRWNKAD